jgi:hypothetical protein
MLAQSKSTTTFIITTLSIMTIRITTISLKGLLVTAYVTLGITKLCNVCHNAESGYPRCCISFIVLLSVVMLNVIMLSVIMLNVVAPVQGS